MMGEDRATNGEQTGGSLIIKRSDVIQCRAPGCSTARQARRIHFHIVALAHLQNMACQLLGGSIDVTGFQHCDDREMLHVCLVARGMLDLCNRRAATLPDTSL